MTIKSFWKTTPRFPPVIEVQCQFPQLWKRKGMSLGWLRLRFQKLTTAGPQSSPTVVPRGNLNRREPNHPRVQIEGIPTLRLPMEQFYITWLDHLQNRVHHTSFSNESMDIPVPMDSMNYGFRPTMVSVQSLLIPPERQSWRTCSFTGSRQTECKLLPLLPSMERRDPILQKPQEKSVNSTETERMDTRWFILTRKDTIDMFLVWIMHLLKWGVPTQPTSILDKMLFLLIPRDQHPQLLHQIPPTITSRFPLRHLLVISLLRGRTTHYLSMEEWILRCLILPTLECMPIRLQLLPRELQSLPLLTPIIPPTTSIILTCLSIIWIRGTIILLRPLIPFCTLLQDPMDIIILHQQMEAVMSTETTTQTAISWLTGHPIILHRQIDYLLPPLLPHLHLHSRSMLHKIFKPWMRGLLHIWVIWVQWITCLFTFKGLLPVLTQNLLMVHTRMVLLLLPHLMDVMDRVNCLLDLQVEDTDHFLILSRRRMARCIMNAISVGRHSDSCPTWRYT